MSDIIIPLRICGIASVYGTRWNDGISLVKGCFRDSLAERKPAMLFDHESDKIVGRWDDVWDSSCGKYLLAAGIVVDDAMISLIRHEALFGLSPGFTPWTSSTDRWRREDIETASLNEVSLVAAPADPQARLGVLTDEMTREEIEKGLFAEEEN